MGSKRTNLQADRQPSTVLLVEDNQGVRMLTARALESRGYRVLSCQGSMEALRLFAKERVDLLLTDIVLPGLDGVGLARKLQEQRPSLPVLLMSGHPKRSFSQSCLSADTGFLGKPFRVSDLVRTVRDSLRSSA